MKTIEEIRLDWLSRLIERHGTIAALNEALGRARTDATLTQIRNMAPNTRSGKVRNMGSELAREIEEKRNTKQSQAKKKPPRFLRRSISWRGNAMTDLNKVFSLQGESIPVVCPVCGDKFHESDARVKSGVKLTCSRGHSFDAHRERGEVMILEKALDNMRRKLMDGPK